MTTTTHRSVLDAVIRIIAERGLDGVSIREVAGAAGVSIGTVQYYGRSKDDLLVAAFEDVVETIGTRWSAEAAKGKVAVALRDAIMANLPLDEERAREGRVYIAFLARAAVDPRLAAVQQRFLAAQRTACAQGFRIAVDRGQAQPGLDPVRAAATTVALVDGLLVQLLTDPSGLSHALVLKIIKDHLARYLLPRSHRR
ncbi:TetR/AcrR family transcriptional regulator [Microlunatus elymi]|nr:TetR/AcrR family transcriptional regulator [Microlunatus elymi]